jgi:hypothetical protein
VILGFRREVAENGALLSYYAARSGNHCVITQKGTVLSTLLFEMWCIQFRRTIVIPRMRIFLYLFLLSVETHHFYTVHLSISVQSVVFAVIIKADIN